MVKLKNKKILVTGGAGFIGSHLVDKLVKMKRKVVVVDNLSSGKKENVNKAAEFYKMDVRSPKLAGIIEKEKIDVVFHFAAQPLVQRAYFNPIETIDSNVMGTLNLLETCRKNKKLQSIVVVSSDKAYGESKELPYKEENPLRGNHPYNASKAMADLLAQTYAKTYGLPIGITRFSNVFGPRDVNLDRIIPGICESVIKNKTLLIRSDGKMVREYTYVADIVDGCIRLAENCDKFRGEAFNFGSNNIFSVISLVKKSEEIFGKKINYKILNITKNEIPKQYLNWEKAEKLLSWHPKVSLREGIKESFNWYKDFLSKNKIYKKLIK